MLRQTRQTNQSKPNNSNQRNRIALSRHNQARFALSLLVFILTFLILNIFDFADFTSNNRQPSVAEAAPGVVWSSPVQAVASSIYPIISVSPTNGDVGLAIQLTSSSAVAFADSAHGFNVVTSFPTSVQANHTNGTFDKNSNFNLVWQDRPGGSGNYHTYYARIAPDGSHIGPTDLTTIGGGGSGLFPAITAIPDGRLFVVDEENSNNIGVIESDDGGSTWTNHTVIGNGGSTSGRAYTRITYDTGYRPHVVYCTDTDVYAVDRNFQGQWSQPTKIDTLGTPGNRAFWTDIAASPTSGDVFAAWQEDGQGGVGTPAEISVARWNSQTGQWQSEVRNVSQSSSSSLYAYEPGITVDGAGVVWVAWRATDSGTTDGAKYTVSFDNGGTYVGPADAIPSGNYSRSDVVNMTAGNGNIYLVQELAVNGSSTFGTWLTQTQGYAPPQPTATPTTVPPTATNTPLPTATATNTPTAVPPTATATNTPVAATNTPTPLPPTATNTPTTSVAATNTPTATTVAAPTATNTPLPTPSTTIVATATTTASVTTTSTPTQTTATNTATSTPTLRNTPTAAPTTIKPTATNNTPTQALPSATPTFTPVPTATPTTVSNNTPTATPTLMPTATPTFTPMPENTPTLTLNATATAQANDNNNQATATALAQVNANAIATATAQANNNILIATATAQSNINIATATAEAQRNIAQATATAQANNNILVATATAQAYSNIQQATAQAKANSQRATATAGANSYKNVATSTPTHSTSYANYPTTASRGFLTTPAPSATTRSYNTGSATPTFATTATNSANNNGYYYNNPSNNGNSYNNSNNGYNNIVAATPTDEIPAIGYFIANTPLPTPTDTPIPTPTDVPTVTPLPTATNTPLPKPTATAIPPAQTGDFNGDGLAGNNNVLTNSTAETANFFSLSQLITLLGLRALLALLMAALLGWLLLPNLFAKSAFAQLFNIGNTKHNQKKGR